MEQAKIGIIGGSGLYDMEELTERREIALDTPFGPPSDKFILGSMHGKRVAFVSRHGRGHRIIPSEINYRANIYAMKMLGVERILSASAVGSLKEEIAPLDIVLPDQFVDRTRGRISTFFGNGLAAHVNFADPVCPELLEAVHAAASQAGIRSMKGGTYLCMEGPAFSTRAESNMYRRLGMDIIGMTNLQEAKLAREAEICYATVALVTDYDCWRENDDTLSIEMIIENLNKNTRNVQQVIREVVPALAAGQRSCICSQALHNAIITREDLIPPQVKNDLRIIIGKYLKG
jgi:5'-methylthioadenosine phosphorylase